MTSPHPYQLIDTATLHSTNGAWLGECVLRKLSNCLDAACLVDVLKKATGGHFYIVGGTVRRALFGSMDHGDLDIMIPNGDFRALEALHSLRVPYELNRSGHHRFHWNAFQLDLFQPQEFYGGFVDVPSALRFFDLKINAIAICPATGTTLDPFNVLSATPIAEPGINWVRWNAMGSLELTILAIRLMKIMYEVRTIRISTADAAALFDSVLPQLLTDWRSVHDRFPLGRRVFLKMFDTHVLRRVAGDNARIADESSGVLQL